MGLRCRRCRGAVRLHGWLRAGRRRPADRCRSTGQRRHADRVGVAVDESGRRRPGAGRTTPVAPGYRLGTEILEQHWGPTGGLIGHHGRTPGYVTVLPVNPERQLAVAVLVPGGPGRIIDTLAGRLLAVMRS
jgi:hypothetical protein